MYDFDTTVNRRGTASLKWDVEEHELPMWVADMDFQTAPEIREALEKRVAHGVFGYTVIPDTWNQAYVNWWEKRHHFLVRPEWLVFCTGVVPAISSAVRKLTTPGENVLIQTPVYNIFFNSIVNNGRNVLESPLVYDGQAYQIDFAQLEKDLANPQTTLMILCNPHNPVGKIWDKETLEKIGNLCEKYHVTVLADEIHCDLTAVGKEYVPFAAVSETCKKISVSLWAPTKTFNIAGLQTAAIMAADPTLRHKMWRALNTDEVAEPNAFAIDAAIAAFTKGEAWLDSLCEYIDGNKQMVKQYLEKELPQVSVVSLDVTYLLWLDCHEITEDSVKLATFIREKTGLYLSEGAEYGGDGRYFLRLNVACPKERLKEGLKRLKEGILAYVS
ncbi:putative aminotransferase B [Clostridium sp. CAG:411]|jgi:cystathionine beta-lyase|nr:MalY/PatB family protein [Lachnospiraceae bacterium]CDE42757.1 putative aminotransferase B [Clostridium sp. CAG:411]